MTNDILILSNGPGEVTTWVRPVVKALRQQLGSDRAVFRISIILSPCPNATGKEAQIVQSYPEVDRVQGAQHFFPFLLWGKTAENWDWRDRGVVVFLGGDQFFPVVIGSRLGYRTVIYAEWDARWHRWIDRFGVMKPSIIAKAPKKYRHKLTVVGDLMADVARGSKGAEEQGKQCRDVPWHVWKQGELGELTQNPVLEGSEGSTLNTSPIEWIGLLPGSKPAKLIQGVPLGLAIAEHIHKVRPQTRFLIPVAPTLDLPTLARFADPQENPLIQKLGWGRARLVMLDGGDEGGFSNIRVTKNDSSETRPYIQNQVSLSEVSTLFRAGFEPKLSSLTKQNSLNPPLHSILKMASGVTVELITEFPAHEILSQCCLCLTTVGANTAELGSLGVPMIVLLPTQQLDAMRAWDGLPGLLARLPGVGTSFAKLINWLILRQGRLFAWPNIWAKAEIVPEVVGQLKPEDVAQLVLEYLEHPEKLEDMRSRLRAVRGESGAAQKLAQLVQEELTNSQPPMINDK
ncbi:lipid-A-disaccharide synthase [Coleofasciculus chthonoplastes]|uniref:lipid-A-disaccharide synthase n=1 Tax=Coleofasciculus chthonoplastes TaxID=64178 RepID=UPI00330194C3